jgi:hypothetical protein
MTYSSEGGSISRKKMGFFSRAGKYVPDGSAAALLPTVRIMRAIEI